METLAQGGMASDNLTAVGIEALYSYLLLHVIWKAIK